MLHMLTNFAVTIAVLPAAEAILVATGSPCSDSCGNVPDSTSTADIVCNQADYTDGYNNGAGQLFQGCIQCELSSPYATSNDYTDAMAMLYNIRYTVSSCVYNFPEDVESVNTPCVTSKACGSFTDAIMYQNLSTEYDGFEYCDIWPINDTTDFLACTQCLQAGGNNYLANFVTTLQAGCVQKPIPGVTVAIQGNLFSNNIVNVSIPTPTAKIDPAWFDQGPLTLSAKVGIAAGGLVFLLIIAGIAIVWNGKRRRRAFLKTLEATYANANANKGGWPSAGPLDRDMGETPISQRPLRGWNDSPMTIHTEKTFQQYFSPYSSQYNSPVSAPNAHQVPWPETVLSSPHEMSLSGGAVGDNSNYDPWLSSPEDKSRTKDESYEMHHVDSAGRGNCDGSRRAVFVEAPILSHPGYGKSSDSRPRQYDAGEQDGKNW